MVLVSTLGAERDWSFSTFVATDFLFHVSLK